MLKKKSVNLILFAAFCLSCSNGFSNNCFADSLPSAFQPLKTIDINTPPAPIQGRSELNVNLNQGSSASTQTVNLDGADNTMASATDRFVQCNIRAAWSDFRSLISTTPDNDFTYISMANKMADLGLFDLSNLAISKMKDKDLTYVSTDAMKRFYYPRKKMKFEDEMFLAEIYSNISFNNQSSEATNELLEKDSLLSNYDYANYLVALGSYKSNFTSRAAKYINIAILQNPSNLNYQCLKAQILAEMDDSSEALKTVENLKKQDLYSYEYEKKIKSLEQFVLYKITKKQWEKDYHLGYYYYLENDSSKAIRTLQTALESRKRPNTGLIYGLMSEIYLSMDEFEKAGDTAKKSCKSDGNNPKALVTLGDLSYMNQKYKQALSYYKKACSQDKKSYIPFIKEAQTYQKLSNTKKATDIYSRVLRTHSDSWEAYYNIALLQPNKRAIYLKKALAVNPLFENAWVELAKIELNSGNYNIAKTYLANAFSIDENDFRYYYYQGLVDNYNGDIAKAEFDFKKCLKLNGNYKEAQTALDVLLKSQNNNLKQDSI